MKQHRVNLTAEERERLQAIAHTGSAKAQGSTRARILLASDEHGPALKDEEIARALGVTRQTVEIVRKKYVSHGLSATVYRAGHKNKGVPVKIDGRVEAHLVALACSPAPDDKPRWTPRRSSVRSWSFCPTPTGGRFVDVQRPSRQQRVGRQRAPRRIGGSNLTCSGTGRRRCIPPPP